MRPVALLQTTLVVAALAVGCVAVRADQGAPVAASCPEAPQLRYFPVGTFGQRDSELVQEWYSKREWYSKNLVAMEEPSLSCGAPVDTEIYRFLWLRTFHNPIAVRVFQLGDDYGLEAVILDGAGGYDPGHVSRRVKRALSRDEWQMVIARLAGIQFWQMTTTGGDLGAFDGAQWIVEAHRNGRYHIVDRWGASESALGSVGRLLMDLADLKAVGPVY